MDNLYHFASQYWTLEASSALIQLNSGFDLRCFTFRHMLGRVPPLPDRFTYGLTRSCCSDWRVTGSANCETSGSPIPVGPVQLKWDVKSPTKASLVSDRFCTWSKSAGGQSNLLAVLVPAWSYILSARFIELQGQEGCRIVYTGSTAPIHQAHENASGFPLDVGNVNAQE